jgi:hypothetical protein
MRAVFLAKMRIIAWGTLILWASTGSFAQTSAPVKWRDSKLSVQFDDTSISQILTSIASTTGIKLTIDPSVSSYKASISFRDMSLRDAILKVLEGSAIDYIVVGDYRSPQMVREVMLLGFAPKITPSSVATGFGQQQSQQIYAAHGGASSLFSGQNLTQQPIPAKPGDRGRFLPFPDATDGGNTQQPGQQAVPVNPFNPYPAGDTSFPATPQPNNEDRTIRRRPPTWPPQTQ